MADSGLSVGVGFVNVDAKVAGKIVGGAIVVIVGLLVLVMILAGAAASKGNKVEVACGPVVTTPLGDQGLNVTGKAGDKMRAPQFASPYQIVKSVFAMLNVFKLWFKNLRTHATGVPEDTAVTGWRNRTQQNQAAALASCCPSTPPPPDSPDEAPAEPEPFDPKSLSLQNSPSTFTKGQLSIARTIVSVAKAKSVPKRGWIVAFATAFQESGMKNLNYGDRDSVGVFQQRAGWGSSAQRQDPKYAAAKFFDALVKVDSWETLPVTVAAQKVQISAYPNAYAKWEDDANRLLGAIGAGADTPAAPPTTPNLDCPAQAGNSGTGDVGGTIATVATLNPTGAGNWQGSVRAGNYWFVAHAYAGDREQIFHRLNSTGRQVDQMSAVGFAHATSFAVIGNTVYATDGHGDVVTFPYRPGTKIKAGTKTGWSGSISADPAGGSIVIRNGNKYRAYNLASHKPVGVQIETDTGARQGFSISGNIVYVLTGATNQAARVDAYSVLSGEQTGTRDITDLAGNVAGSHREPEGLYGNMVGVKANTGNRRRLYVFSIGDADNKGGGSTPAGFNKQGNPRTVEQAVAWLEKMEANKTGITVNQCSHYMAEAYGWDNSGSPTALSLWGAIPASLKHPGKSSPPRGALVFWTTGVTPGHVAMSLGNGMIASTDIPRGRIGIVPIAKIDRWGPRVGWAVPHWPAHSKGTDA